MKKLILVLAIALVSCPAFAALDVNLVLVDSDTVSVVYSGADSANLPRAFALTIAIDGTGTFTAINGYKTGESTSGSKGFGIYPARIQIDSTGAVTGYGNPLADGNDPGAAGTGLGTATVILEFGSLYFGDVNAPATSGTLCTLDFAKGTATQITLADELTYRGGIVLEDGTQVDDSALVTLAVPECFPGAPGQAKYDQWALVGKPDCWCAVINPRQCRGDADGKVEGKGKVWVYSNDLTILQNAWNKAYSAIAGQTYTGNGVTTLLICADFSHTPEGKGNARVFSGDLSILQANWNSATTPADCATQGY